MNEWMNEWIKSKAYTLFCQGSRPMEIDGLTKSDVSQNPISEKKATDAWRWRILSFVLLPQSKGKNITDLLYCYQDTISFLTFTLTGLLLCNHDTLDLGLYHQSY